jgi:hypothetical protein
VVRAPGSPRPAVDPPCEATWYVCTSRQYRRREQRDARAQSDEEMAGSHSTSPKYMMRATLVWLWSAET